MGASPLHVELRRALESLRRPDGGFATTAGGSSEVEPTVMAALALGSDDRRARVWLERHQRADGAFLQADRRPVGPTGSALAALVLGGERARRAIDYAVSRRGLPPPEAADQSRRGWGWTSEARSFVEPTSRVLIASNLVPPRDASARGEAVAVLGERQCVDGGWNHGITTVLDEHLPGYVQTSAIALIALAGEPRPFVRTGLEFVRQSWRTEPGGLTTAQVAVAFHLHGLDEDAAHARTALATIARRRRRSSAGRSVSHGRCSQPARMHCSTRCGVRA